MQTPSGQVILQLVASTTCLMLTTGRASGCKILLQLFHNGIDMSLWRTIQTTQVWKHGFKTYRKKEKIT